MNEPSRTAIVFVCDGTMPTPKRTSAKFLSTLLFVSGKQVAHILWARDFFPFHMEFGNHVHEEEAAKITEELVSLRRRGYWKSCLSSPFSNSLVFK